ncbi:MAG: aldehyde dehydrogenase family protein [Actinomycetia bacterium]|nr:aldehyde dehydrogenase family protein [Actinomycetes bacterium]
MSAPKPFYVAGHSQTSSEVQTVWSPDGTQVGEHAIPTDADVATAVAAAAAALPACQALTAADRSAALLRVSQQIALRSEEFAQTITAEGGKPLMWSRMEVTRAVATFRWAAEEARRWSGELQRLDTDPSAAGRTALVRRFSFGAILGIAPFNFPLNLVAHKVAPAIAVGAPIILKPAPATPLTALLLGEILSETELPLGAWSVLPLDNDRTEALVQDPRLPIISFTGSERVGYAIQDAVPRKHVVLELGGNAAAAVCADFSSEADLEWAGSRIATFGNYQAGQSCISVQRVFVANSLASGFIEDLTARVAALPTGAPEDPETVVGPLINEQAAERVVAWIEEAVQEGATLLTGGTRVGATVAPTLLTDVAPTSKVACEEVFGPVMTVTAVPDDPEAIFAAINASKYGLQAGLFTHDIQTAFAAQRALEVGGVIIGDVPSFRADQMPYGGEKASGVGREGLLAAMTDFTHDRVMVLTGLDL